MSKEQERPQTSEELLAESQTLKDVQEMLDPIKVQEDRVLDAKTSEDIGKLIEKKRISLEVGIGGVNLVGSDGSDTPKVKEILGNFIKNEVLTDKWQPKDKKDIELKNELVSHAIENIVDRDKYSINQGRESSISIELKESYDKVVKEYVDEKIQDFRGEQDDGKSITKIYSNPATLSHLMEHHPKCISPGNKSEIIKLEENYQKQEFGDLIKDQRVSKGADQPFSKHEKEAMKLLYEEKNKHSTAFKEHKITKEDVHHALVAARSKSIRGTITNMKRIGVPSAMKAVMSNMMSKKTGRSI